MRRECWLKIILVLLGVIVLLGAIYYGGRWLEDSAMKPEARGNHLQRYEYEDTIEVDGVSYRKRRNLTSILLMGVDAGSTAGTYRNGGQADFLRLLVIDTANRRITQVQIDRDTMTPITILGVLGNQSGMRTSQICLAHGFGDGKEQSCELTVSAVSNFLLGTPVDFYIAMNLDGISVLNDWVGGVTVTLEDDFSAIDPAMTPGTTLTLVGDQAEIFVRTRRSIGVGTNEARMKRQQVYIEQLGVQLDGMLKDSQDSIGALYDTLAPYLVTNMSRGRLINEIWAAKDYERSVTAPAGEHTIGADGFMQFQADEDALQQLVLDLFYDKR